MTSGSLTAVGEEIGQRSLGTFEHTGGTHTVGFIENNLVGTLIIGQSGGEGTYNLNAEVLNTANTIVGDADDSIGTFKQMDGKHRVGFGFDPNGKFGGTLTIGKSGGEGTYNLNAGILNATNEIIGEGTDSIGTFTQEAGARHTVGYELESGRLSGDLTIGKSGGEGNYNLNAGILKAEDEIVGDGEGSIGILTQEGGDNKVEDILRIGASGGKGNYNLNAGILKAENAEVVGVGDGSIGTFAQTAGTHTVGVNFGIGVDGGRGSYNLSGAGSLLTATEEYIGLAGVGRFEQTGGTHSVSGTLRIGGAEGIEGIGEYDLRGGNLDVAKETIGDGGTGTFSQSGGAHRVNDTLTIGKTGEYRLSGGTLSIGNLLQNDGTFTQSGGELSATAFVNNPDGRYEHSGGTFSGSFLVNDGKAVFSPSKLTNFAANISGEGDLTKLGDATLVLTGTNTYYGGTLVSSGVLQGNTTSLQGDITNNATVVFDQAETDTFRGTIGGAGKVVKQDAGLLVFNEQNTYTGGTQILGGNLQVGDASPPDASILGLVGVGPNGILSGHGTINGSVDNAGTIAPGGSIGTLTVTGDVAFQSGSTYQVDIDPTESDRLDVGGTASLGGAQVDVLAADGAYGPKRYTILSAGSLDGRFSDQVTSNFALIDPLLTPSLAYDARNVYLDLVPAPLQDPMAASTDVAEDLVFMIDRMTTGRFNQAMGELCPTSLGVWARGFGMVSSASATGDIPGYDGDTSGFVLGMDGQPTAHLSLGIVGFSANVDVTTNTNFTDRSTVDLLGFNLYGAYTHGAWQVRSALGYSNESYSSRQTIAGGAQRRRAGGSTEANRISNYTEGSYTFKSHNLSVQPMLAVQFGWMDQDDFTQQGLFADGQSLNVGGRSQKVFDTLVGARARQEVRFGNNKKVQAELRALYMRRFGDLEDSIDGTLTGGQAVSLGTQDRPGARNAGILGAGVTWLTGNNINFYLDYNGQFLDNQTSSFFGAGMRYVW